MQYEENISSKASEFPENNKKCSLVTSSSYFQTNVCIDNVTTITNLQKFWSIHFKIWENICIICHDVNFYVHQRILDIIKGLIYKTQYSIISDLNLLYIYTEEKIYQYFLKFWNESFRIWKKIPVYILYIYILHKY